MIATQLLLVLVLLAAPLAAEAQQAKTIYRIGFVARPETADSLPGRAFHEGLRDLGWVEGHTIAIDLGWDRRR